MSGTKFSFYIFLSSLFAKINGSQKNLQNYTSGAVGDGGRDLPPCPTAIGRRAVL
jgi:hypothetical protein